MCNASLTRCYLEIELVNFGLETLLSSYGVICSPWRLFFAIRSPSTSKLPRTTAFQLEFVPEGRRRPRRNVENKRVEASFHMTAYMNYFYWRLTCIDGVGLRPFRNAHAHLILPRDCGLAQGSTKQALALIYCDRALFESLLPAAVLGY